MIYLLDTNTVSYIVKGQCRHARRKLERVSVDHDVCISVMTEAEIRFGLARGKLSAATEAAVELFLSKIDILVGTPPLRGPTRRPAPPWNESASCWRTWTC